MSTQETESKQAAPEPQAAQTQPQPVPARQPQPLRTAPARRSAAPILGAILCAAVCLVFFYCRCVLGRTVYEVADDETLNLIAAGAVSPGKSQYLIYIHVFIGYLLKALYAIVPGTNWYLKLQLAGNLAALVLLCVTLTSGLPVIERLLFTLLLNELFARELFSIIQYSKSAAFYTLTGACLLCAAILRGGRRSEDPAPPVKEDPAPPAKEDPAPPATGDPAAPTDPAAQGARDRISTALPRTATAVIGLLLMAVGAMVREESFLSVVPFAVAAFLICGLGSKRRLGRAAVYSAAVIAVFLVLHLTDAAAYKGEPGWEKFQSFNAVRTELIDYQMPEYALHKDAYARIGVGSGTYNALDRWIYADPDVFTEEKLRQIVGIRSEEEQAQTRLRITPEAIAETAEHVQDELTVHRFAAALLAVFAVATLLKKKVPMSTALLFIVFLLGEYWYLTCRGRIVWRGEFGLWAAAFVLTLQQLMRELRRNVPAGSAGQRQPSGDRLRGALCLLMIALLLTAEGAAGYYRLLERTVIAEREEEKRIAAGRKEERPDADWAFRYAQDHKEDAVFVCDPAPIAGNSVETIYGITAERYRGRCENVVYMGGWSVPSPLWEDSLAYCRIDNPLRAILERKDLYVIGSSTTCGILREYFRDQYGVEVSFTKIRKKGKIGIYRPVIEQK